MSARMYGTDWNVFESYVCTLVCIDDLQVRDMSPDVVPVVQSYHRCSDATSDWHILICTCVPSQDIKHLPRVLEGFPAVVALHQTDHLRRDLPLVLQPSDLT